MSEGDLELRVAWERHLGRSTAATVWLASLASRYREPHRHYHDIRHVRWVVRHVQELATDRRLVDVDAVVAAAFFHDAIYDPRAADNEAASAELADGALQELGWPADRIATVRALVMGTIEHRWGDGITVDADVLNAADLGVLAAEPAGYSDYVRNVRREYEHVTDDEWREGRARVLRSFLDRPAIYAPRLGLTEWEQRARGNLTAELRSLDD